MSLQPAVIEDFPGLDLRSDPEQSGCVDMSNVQLEQGYVRSREGYSAVLSASPTTTIGRIGSSTDGGVLFVDSNQDMVHTFIGGATTTMASTIQRTNGGFLPNPPGVPPNTSYYGFGSATTTFSSIQGGVPVLGGVVNPGGTAINPAFTWPVELAVTPNSNRMIWGYGDTVWFSGPGTPQVFPANNFVELDPQNGENINAIVGWRELVFVFKRTKFYVFFGESTSSTGDPIFDYREVRGRGCIAGQGGGVAVGPDGVYFISSDGIYVTTGGDPQKISQPLDPLWGLAPLSPLYSGSAFSSATLTLAEASLTWASGRLYASVPSSGTSPTQVLVFTPGLGWAIWQGRAHRWLMTSMYGDRLLASYQVGAQGNVGLYTDGLTTDAGVAFASSYRSGFMNLGTPGVEKTVRETRLTGMGTPGFAWSRDFGALATPQTVTLGTAPATDRGRHRVAVRGEVLSWQASAASGAWRLNRVVPMMREERSVGQQT